jgi:hypothetical protein
MTTLATALPAPRLSEKTLIRVQAVSGLVFGVFLLLHLGNLAAALLGQASYDAFMRNARLYYQFPLVEIAGVVGAAGVHLGAGVMRILRRRKAAQADTTPTWRVRLHRWSGYYLMAAFAGHVAATRLPGLFGHPADFSFLTFSLTFAGAFFYPYYALFAASGLYHLTHGTIVGLRVLGVKLPRAATNPRSIPFWAWSALGAVVALAGVLALGGNFFAVDTARFDEWRGVYDFVPERLRPW